MNTEPSLWIIISDRVDDEPGSKAGYDTGASDRGIELPSGRNRHRTSIDTVSPFEKLNGFSSHPHWLRNFLITSSLNGKGDGNFRKYTIRQN